MLQTNIFMVALVSILFSSSLYAENITVIDAWSRASAPGQANGSVAVTITSTKDARLIAVHSAAAASAEIHTMSMDGGIMKMRQLNELPLPAKKSVSLAPGKEHIMLFGLKAPLKTGDEIPLTLTIQFSDKRTEVVNFKAQVRSLTAEQHNEHHH